MKRANLLLTDQSSSGSKMATTGLSTPSGSTRTKAAKGLFSHFMFLASLLLIALLTSGKALAETYDHTITLAADEPTCHLSIDRTGEKTVTLTAAVGYSLPTEFNTVMMGATALTYTTDAAEGETYLYNPGNGQVTINAAAITDDIVITATALSSDATLSDLKYQLGTTKAENVTDFASGTETYTLTEIAFTKEAKVTLVGTLNDATANITTNEAVNITTNPDGTQSAEVTITVTAQDGKTKTYTVNLTFVKDELIAVTPPTAEALTTRKGNANDAVDELNGRSITTAITTQSGAENEKQDVTWSFDEAANSGPYKTAGGESNEFTWTINPTKLTVSDPSILTGHITIANVVAATENVLTALQYQLPAGQTSDITLEESAEDKTYTVSLLNGTEDGDITVTATTSEYATITGADGQPFSSGTVTLISGTATLVLTVTSESGAARTVTITFNVDTEESITGVTGITDKELPQAVTTSDDVITLLEANVTPTITSTGSSTFKLKWEYKAESNAGSPFKPGSGETNVFDWKVVNESGDDAHPAPDVDISGKITVTNHTTSTDATLATLQYQIGDADAKDITIGNQDGTTVAITVPALPFGTTAITLLATASNQFATIAKVDEPAAPDIQSVKAETVSLPVTIDAAGTTYKLKVTAEDKSTNKTFTLTFSVAKEKITKVTVPATYKLPEAVDNEAGAKKLLAAMEGVEIKTESGKTPMKLEWTYDNSDNNSQAYSNEDGKTHKFIWKVVRDGEGAELETAETVTITGKTDVTNFMPAVTGDQSQKDVQITADKPVDKIGDGSTPTTVKSIEIVAAVTTDQLTINKATIGKLDLQGSVDEVVLKEATIPEVVLAATKTTTLILQSGNTIDKITNAGTLTLQDAEATPAGAAQSMTLETRAGLTNDGAVGAVDNSGVFTDMTATIVTVAGAADLTITSRPTSKSTTGSSATLAVAATSENGTVSYKWQKYTDQWVAADGTEESLTIAKTTNGTTKYRCEVKSTNDRESATTTLYTPAVTVQFYTSTPDEPSTPSTPTYTVSLDKVTGATFSKSETTTVDEGDNFSFKITLDKDYDQSKPVVTVDGKAITADADGNYTIKNIQKDIKIIVSGIVKNTATGIEENVADAARAWTVGSTLYIHVPETSDVYIISGTGALQQQLRGVSGDYNMQLRAGFYIVRIGNVSQKVIIR
ncbi:MAG: hypothetical protein ACK5N4_11115 [Parabacteroides gordonii]|uniref:hypothetical protein n=1 Tax=Parabacteroides gordonii TaxID=574930 RepID=UPI003A8A11F9